MQKLEILRSNNVSRVNSQAGFGNRSNVVGINGLQSSTVTKDLDLNNMSINNKINTWLNKSKIMNANS